MTQIIDGKKLANELQVALKARAEVCRQHGHQPGLAVVLVGDNPASQVYVRNKVKACENTGIRSIEVRLPAETTEEELLAHVHRLNNDPEVDGILVQLPLPGHINEKDVLNAIDPAKDVDGFHPYNVGALSCGEEGFVPGTPAGIIELLKRSDIRIDGKECVVIGRSNIVGKPIAQLLLAENGTVTIAHSHTVNLKEVTKRADILVVAIGKRQMIDAEYVKPGAAVIDVGIHRDEANHLCGDVDYESVFPVASAITPVPGGVGPMTIAMLMNNCVETVRS